MTDDPERVDARGDERAPAARRALVIVLVVNGVLIAMALVALAMGGESVEGPLQFFSRDWPRLAWQIGIPLLLIAVRPSWQGPLGLALDRLPRGLRGVWLFGPPLFLAVLLINYAHGRFDRYEMTAAAIVLSSSYYFVLNALAEELFFRGLVQSFLVDLCRSRAAGLVLASIVFGLYHIPMFGWGLTDAIMPAVGGLIFGLAFLRTGSIVAPWFLHGLADWALLNDTYGTHLLRFLLG